MKNSFQWFPPEQGDPNYFMLQQSVNVSRYHQVLVLSTNQQKLKILQSLLDLPEPFDETCEIFTSTYRQVLSMYIELLYQDQGANYTQVQLPIDLDLFEDQLEAQIEKMGLSDGFEKIKSDSSTDEMVKEIQEFIDLSEPPQPSDDTNNPDAASSGSSSDDEDDSSSSYDDDSSDSSDDDSSSSSDDDSSSMPGLLSSSVEEKKDSDHLILETTITEENREHWIRFVTKNCDALHSFMKVVDFGFAFSWVADDWEKSEDGYAIEFFRRAIELDFVDLFMALDLEWPEMALEYAIEKESFRIATYLSRIDQEMVDTVLKKYYRRKRFELIRKFLSNVYISKLDSSLYTKLTANSIFYSVLIEQNFTDVKKDIIEHLVKKGKYTELKEFMSTYF